MVSELLESLLLAAVLKARADAHTEHGPFMPPETFLMVERCNQLLADAGRHDLL